MKLKAKKIIAREFLLLMLTLGIGVGGFSCTYLYNFYHQEKSKKISKEIAAKVYSADSLVKSFDNKIKVHDWFYYKNKERFDLSKSLYSSPEKLWNRMNELAIKDSIKIRYLEIWTPELKELLSDIGFETPEQLQDFIDINRITPEDSSNYQKGNSIRQEIKLLQIESANHESNVFIFKSQIKFGFLTFVVSFILLFAVRYTYYAIKWSIKTLKQK